MHLSAISLAVTAVRGAIGAAPPVRQLVSEGDSITATPGSGGTTTYAANYALVASPAVTFSNPSVPGSVLTDLTTRAASDDALIPANGLGILSVMIGYGNLNSGTAAAFLSGLATYLDARKEAGWCVVLLPTLPSTTAGFSAKWNVVYPALAAFADVHCDYVMDTSSNLMWVEANAASTTYYLDGIHPTQVGQDLIKGTYTTLINSITARKVMKPVLSVASGTYNNDFTVSVTGFLPSTAVVHYTTDGTTPTSASPVASGGNITIDGTVTTAGSVTLKVIATKTGYTDSTVATATYVLQAADPVFSQPSGSIGAQNISITDATTGATINYTRDGTTPNSGKPVYSGAYAVSVNETDKAIARKTGYVDSNVVSVTYTISGAFMAATGGTITTVGNFKVHTFTAGGTFTVTSPGDATYLVVAGGGGGGSLGGGGGAAGGMRTGTFTAMAAAGYAVVVGAGGAGGVANTSAGTTGSDSSVNGITSLGGGGGGGAPSVGTAGKNGGSGGGGAYGNATAGTGTVGQGSDGGAGGASGGGGGGGGAGAVGGAYGGSVGGNGGAGSASSITGASVTYAGGGGGAAATTGGTGGAGGGGAGKTASTTGTAGTANTGGGGGGGYNGTGGAGGDGVVILSYQFQ